MRLRKYLKTCDKVYHTTLDPNGPGVIRIHLIPPKILKPGVPWACILNGYSILPLQTSWAILLKEFIEELNKHDGVAISSEDIEDILGIVATNVKKVFPYEEKSVFLNDLDDIIETLEDIISGKEPKNNIGFMNLQKYSKYMTAPHRMDLMISAMEKNSCWNCNQKCLHCYASGEALANTKELSTEEWFTIIDKLQEDRIPSLTFTGGEPTMRDDLPELIDHAKWFVTRLNTNGILLTKELCERLYNASLDSVQITLYSSKREIHNLLVGGDHFTETIYGIKNAISANLDVSINTPLCDINSDYLSTIKFANSLGVHYFSCSGLIPSGNALKNESTQTALSKEKIYNIVYEAWKWCKENKCELSFTSPGWIDASKLNEMKMVVPSCGACLSNMAINPSGEVIPCQSWLKDNSLGNLLEKDFKEIWESKDCLKIRKESVKSLEVCLLRKRETI